MGSLAAVEGGGVCWRPTSSLLCRLAAASPCAPPTPEEALRVFESLLPGQPFYERPHGGHMCVSCTPRVCTPPPPQPQPRWGGGYQQCGVSGRWPRVAGDSLMVAGYMGMGSWPGRLCAEGCTPQTGLTRVCVLVCTRDRVSEAPALGWLWGVYCTLGGVCTTSDCGTFAWGLCVCTRQGPELSPRGHVSQQWVWSGPHGVCINGANWHLAAWECRASHRVCVSRHEQPRGCLEGRWAPV